MKKEIKDLIILIITLLLISEQVISNPVEKLEPEKERKTSISVFPILMYDSDIGFGFGGKGVIKNHFKKNESFDLMLFGSTKGEQRYAFVFSVPDFEIRQGTYYPLAFDLKIEYNKLLNSNFFGFGNDSPDNEFQFPREVTRMELTLSHTFTPRLVGEIWLRQNHYSVYGFKPEWQTITSETPGAGETDITACSVRFRYDSRNSQIHPQKGIKVDVQGEVAFPVFTSEWNFQKLRCECSFYKQLFLKNHILALRYWMQHLEGDAPFYEMSFIGGGWTARGFKAERFLDHTMALLSLEYRFPIYSKLGGVLFVDSGRVWPSLQDYSFTSWHSNMGSGLRYYLTNFVVRFDLGHSQEGTRIFFNFGHVF